MTTPTSDYDSPWKGALETYLEDFFALFLPSVHAEIDWSRKPVFLDTELQQVVRDAELGRRLADKLVQVWRRDGSDAWVLIHIEVQSSEEANFARRVFTYYYRLVDRYDRPVMSLAVLADERATWRPSVYETALWGCELTFHFPVVKLRDWVTQRATLEVDPNPFAAIVLAHLAAQETRRDAAARGLAKFALTRRLYDLGYDKQQILTLFNFVDWMLQLPHDLEVAFSTALRQFEQERNVTYITSIERIGREEGREEGLQEGIQIGERRALFTGIVAALQLRFGDNGATLLPELQSVSDVALLQAVLERTVTATSLDELRAIYRPDNNS